MQCIIRKFVYINIFLGTMITSCFAIFLNYCQSTASLCNNLLICRNNGCDHLRQTEFWGAVSFRWPFAPGSQFYWWQEFMEEFNCDQDRANVHEIMTTELTLATRSMSLSEVVNETITSAFMTWIIFSHKLCPEMEAVMEVYWQRRFAEEFVLWQGEALGGTDGVLLLPGAPAPACFTSHLRPATSATITSCSIDSVAIVGGQGEKLMAVRGQQWWYLDSITWVRNAIATPSPPPRIYTYHPLYTMVPDHKVHLHRGSCWHRYTCSGWSRR